MPRKNRRILSLITNLGLLLAGSAMALSGLVIQFSYHMGHHGTIDKAFPVLGMSYVGWSNSHLVSIVIVSFLAAMHITLHWKWYKTIVRKKLFAKNHLAIILTIVFVVVATTGYIPWFIKLGGASEATRKAFIEVHDKLAFVLFAYLAIHVTKTYRWFIASFKKR
jgi:hypothetical protein